MSMSEFEAYEKLLTLNDAQLVYIIKCLNLPREFLPDQAARAQRAADILDLLKQRPHWLDDLEKALHKAFSGANDYLCDRLAPIRQFLTEPPSNPELLPSTSGGTVKELRNGLSELTSPLERPEGVEDVTGTLFPAMLLTEGWWERKREEKYLDIEDPLQRWLFKGFDLWAPSWDISWEFENPNDPDMSRYFIAQLTDGDEADSLRVIVPPALARRLRDDFRDSWGGFEAKITGRLGHKYQFEKELPKELEGELQDFYIWLDDYNRLSAKTDLYSGYLWKCVVPSERLKESAFLGIDDVYFIWDHTNFAAKDAVQYNLDSLLYKEGLVAKRHPGSQLILLQKSHAIVPGDPRWPAKQFIDLLAGLRVESPATDVGTSRESPRG